MNKTLKKSLIGGLLAVTMISNANAAWVCRATSSTGWGEGYSFSKWTAQNIALTECSKNTPRWAVCVVRKCWWIN